MKAYKDTMVSKVHAFLLLHKWLVTFLFILCLAVAGLVAMQSRTDMSTLSFFPDADPELIRMAEALHMAPFSRLLMVDFSLAQENVHAAQHSETLVETAQKVLQAIPASLAVHATAVPELDPAKMLPLIPALTDAKALAYLESQVQEQAMQEHMQGAKAQLGQLWGSFALPWLQQDPLQFRDVLLSRLPSAQSFGQGFGQVDAQSGLVRSDDGQHVLLVLRPQFSMHDVEQSAQLVQALDAAIEEFVPAHIQVLTTGAHRHSAANARTIESDIQRILLWSLVGFAAVYVLFVRSWTGALWLLLTPVVAGTLALGAVASIWSLIAGLALGFGASILGIAEDYAMHMHFALRHAKGRGESSASVLNVLYKPLLQAFLLNATGFGVLLFSAIPALRQLAAFALCTLAAGLLFALIILPLWSSFAVPPMVSAMKGGLGNFEHAAKPILRMQAALLCVFVLLLLCAGLWQKISVDVSPQSMGADVAQIRQDMQHMQSIWGQNPTAKHGEGSAQEIIVVQGTTLEEALAHAQEVVQILQKDGIQGQALSNLWPSATQMQANMARWQDFVWRHPHLYTQVQNLGLEQGFTQQSFAPFQDWLLQSPKAINADLLAEAGLSSLVHSFVEMGKNSQGEERYFSLVMFGGANSHEGADISQALPSHAVLLSAQGLEKKLVQILQAEQYLFPITGLLCVVLLLIFSPHKKDILLAALPPLVALNGILGVFLWQDMALTLASMAALPLVLGLAVDHGIVMTHELTEGRDYGVTCAIITSSCTAILGMGLLMLAEHPALHSMGQVIVAGLVVEVPVALWIIPLFYKQVNKV